MVGSEVKKYFKKSCLFPFQFFFPLPLRVPVLDAWLPGLAAALAAPGRAPELGRRTRSRERLVECGRDSRVLFKKGMRFKEEEEEEEEDHGS